MPLLINQRMLFIQGSGKSALYRKDQHSSSLFKATTLLISYIMDLKNIFPTARTLRYIVNILLASTTNFFSSMYI